MVEVDGAAYLIWQKLLLQWSFAAYTEVEEPHPLRQRVQVLTPASIVRMLSGGFRPEVHASAREVIAGSTYAGNRPILR
jgi:hypothetical protein